MDAALERFSPATREWFAGAFAAPTAARACDMRGGQDVPFLGHDHAASLGRSHAHADGVLHHLLAEAFGDGLHRLELRDGFWRATGKD